MVARRPLCLVSGLVSELPSGDVASAGSSSVEFVAGTGLYGGGYISQLPRYDVKVAPEASGIIFVGNNLALDGSALATATEAAASGFPAAVSASSALASGNAALDISVQALASGNDALAIVEPLAGGGTRLTFTAATTVPAGVPVGLNDAGQIEPIRAPYWCTPVISGIYVPSGAGGSQVIASGTEFWIQPTGVITPGTQAMRLTYYMLNYDFDIKYCTDYDDFILTQPSQGSRQLTQILKPGPGGYLYASNNPRQHMSDNYYFYWSRLDECRDIKRYLIGGTYSSNYYPYVQDFGRDNDNLYLGSIGTSVESIAAYYFDTCYLANGIFIVTYSTSSYILKVRAGYIDTYSTPGFGPTSEQITPASVYDITTVKHKDPNKAVCFFNKSSEGKTYACLLTVNTEDLNVDVSFPIEIIGTSGLELQAKYIEEDDSYVLIATVSSRVRLYRIKEVTPAVFQVVSDTEIGGFYGYNNSIDYDPTSRTLGFITNDYYTSMVAGYTQPSGDYFTPVQSGRLDLDRYNGNCRSQFHRGTGQFYGLHYAYYQYGLRCTPIAAPFSDFPALPHANKASNFIGIASDNVVSGQNCTVVMPGEIYTQPSGNLYPGQPVYLDILNSGVTQNPLKPASWSGQVDWNSIGVAVSPSGYTLRNLL